ncbi:uncharacterized protein LOC106668226 [Cimex lectularius]|uniref:Uncharacterized protein n=1 Tax=Cimex lectularius TaxID=79782 RepID=A0A8I6S2J6_CIMLE|nr:uncharacterized protein LOC106668226 [Cimex lectularius]
MTAMFSVVFLAIMLGVASCTINEESRDFMGYNPSPVGYETYDNSATYNTVEKWPPTSLALPSFGACGGSLLKPLLAGLVGAALLKLPVLIAAKLLLLKLALPLGLLTAAAPLALPLVYMFFSKGKESSSSTPKPPAMEEGRALYQFLESSSCLERIACSVGRSQSKTPTVKAFSWMLKSLESMLGKQEEARARVGSYRSAYLAGAAKDAVSCSSYKCNLPEIFMRQGESSYKLF